MQKKRVTIFTILLPAFLLAILMTVALINYPVIFEKAKETVVIVFVAMVVYVLVWAFIKPDNFSKNGGLLIGSLFIVNISMEEFINWQTHTSMLISTLTMMFLIFISFSIISALKTVQTQNIFKGIKSSFVSALLGTIIALCFGFLIDYLFSDRMISVLKNYPGYNDYSNPKAFTFFNSFDNASNHVIIAPIVSLIMGSLGGAIALISIRVKKRKHTAL